MSQVHTLKLIDGAVPVSRRQGERLVNMVVPRSSPHPPFPGLSFTLATFATWGGLAMGVTIAHSNSSLPLKKKKKKNSYLPLLFPKDHETEIRPT